MYFDHGEYIDYIVSDETFGRDNTGWNEFEGYKIVTSKRTIKLGIDFRHECCENFGYVTSEDDLSFFTGAVLLDMKFTDTALNTKIMSELQEVENDAAPDAMPTELMFVDFITDRGTLQFVFYNSHNGAYGHDAVVYFDDKVIREQKL